MNARVCLFDALAWAFGLQDKPDPLHRWLNLCFTTIVHWYEVFIQHPVGIITTCEDGPQLCEIRLADPFV